MMIKNRFRAVLRAAFAIAVTAAVLLTGFTPPAEAATRTLIDKNCRTIVAGRICVEMTKYVSSSVSRHEWRVSVSPVQGRWIQPLKYTTFGIMMGGDTPPICDSGTCPKFTSKKVGKWHRSDPVTKIWYRSAHGTNTLTAGRDSRQTPPNCKPIVAGKVCLTLIARLTREKASTASVLQVYPKAGRTITPKSHRLYNGDGTIRAQKSYCSNGCKPVSRAWGGTLTTTGWVVSANASYWTTSGDSGISVRF